MCCDSRARLQSACGQAGSHWRCFYQICILYAARCTVPWSFCRPPKHPHSHTHTHIRAQTYETNCRLSDGPRHRMPELRFATSQKQYQPRIESSLPRFKYFQQSPDIVTRCDLLDEKFRCRTQMYIRKALKTSQPRNVIALVHEASSRED